MRRAKLTHMLNVRPEEVRLVLLIFVMGILLYTSNVLLRTASFALFLDVYDSQTLPYMYIGIGIAATAASLLYLRLTNRFSLSQVLIGCLAFLLLTLIGCRAGLMLADSSWFVFVLPIYFGVSNALTITAFWGLLGRVFNLDQGKRLFGMLTCSEHLATILAGFMAPALVGWQGTASLFNVSALAMAGALGVLVVITRLYRPLMQIPVSRAESAGTDAEKENGSPRLNRYVLLICVVFTLFILGAYIADNIFYAQAEIQFTDEVQLANFLGLFWGVVGVLSLLMQLFVSGWMLRRFGVRSILLFTPITLGGSGFLMALAGLLRAETIALFGIALIANTFRLVLDATDAAAVNLLYQPLSPHQRTQAQTLLTGVVYPIAIGAVGLFLLLLVDGFGLNTQQLALVLLMVAITWIIAVILLGKAYLRRLQQALVGCVPKTVIDRRLQTQEMRAVYAEVQAEVSHASYLLASLHSTAESHGQQAGEPLIPAFIQSRERILCGLSDIYDIAVIAEMRHLLEGTALDDMTMRQQRAIMLEMLEMTLPRSLKPRIIPLFADVPENRDSTA